ncbi:Inhibitor of the KinA pathway to sporulation, predicted exonuclease [Ruminococcaceae bacterium YRB3002]|nr:Inhibitor of the KinA pathway to sporulation, predicted exonuclease [Ruminococcaceae bacterium YRB3002]
MLNFPITDGMELVVFDMEWNQPIYGKEYGFDVSALTGEIIEIGAVKYTYENGNLIRGKQFSRNIKPQVYTKLHYHVKKVTGKSNSDLLNGVSFAMAYHAFRAFIGKAQILVGWGNSDTAMLKQNLKFFDMDDDLNVYFLDLQPLFSLFSGEKGKQRSVEFAVDFYGIDKRIGFHSATSDAIYTGRILEKIFEQNKTAQVLSTISSSAIDPDVVSEFTFVGSPCASQDMAYEGARAFWATCPICKTALNEKIKRFRIRKSEYALLFCPEHGEFFARSRSKKNKTGEFYVSSVMRLATQNDYYLVACKKEEFDKYGASGAPKEEPEEETGE